MSIKNLLLALIGISLLSLGGWGLLLKSEKQVAMLTSNLSQSEVKYKALDGRTASQMRMLIADNSDLKAANGKSDSLKSLYNAQLSEAYKEIKNLKLRPANVVTVVETEYVTNDSGLVSRDSIIRLPLVISRPHYRFELYRQGDSLMHKNSYWNSLTVIESRERYFNDGRRIKHPRWYFWKKWIPVTTVVSDDSSATANIKVAVKLL